MPCTISKLRRRQRIALTQAERKFDTSGRKSPYSEDPRNSCTRTSSAIRQVTVSKSRLAAKKLQDVFIRGGTKRYLSLPNERGMNGARKVGYAN